MDHVIAFHDELDPWVAEALARAYPGDVDIETAARHLWILHRVGTPDLLAAPASRRSGALRRTAVSVLAAVMLASSSGAAVAASRSALPGDVLYPVKRGAEQAQLILAGSPEAQAELRLKFGRTRLDELRAVRDSRPEAVERLVADIYAVLGDAGDADAGSQTLRQAAEAEIAALGPDLPPRPPAAAAVPVPETSVVGSVSSEVPPAPPAGAPTPPAIVPGATPTPAPVATPTPAPTPTPVATPTPTPPPPESSTATSPVPTAGPSAPATAPGLPSADGGGQQGVEAPPPTKPPERTPQQAPAPEPHSEAEGWTSPGRPWPRPSVPILPGAD